MILFLLLSCIFYEATAQQRAFTIIKGSSLTPANSSYWSSASGHFAFGFYPQGERFSIGVWMPRIKQKTVVWTANRDNLTLPSDAALIFNTDGRLIVQLNQSQQIPISNVNQSASSASMLDSGNFVLYDSESKIIWQTFASPTDTIVEGQPLLADRRLVSSISETNRSRGIFELIMQDDGNLVMYPTDLSPRISAYAYWSTFTSLAGNNVSLRLDGDGQLYMLNSTGFVIKTLRNRGTVSGNSIHRATVDADGIFRLYSHNLDQNSDWSIEWKAPENICDPIGFCGLNSYCTIINQGSDCACLPGFDFIDRGQKNLGCRRNSTLDDCISFEKSNFTMHELDNLSWEDGPYSTLTSSTSIQCRDWCLEDCYCEAAIYNNKECRKQKLPLRFGRFRQDGQITTFVKVSIGESGGEDRRLEPPPTSTKNRNKLQIGILVGGVICLALGLIGLAISSILTLRYRVSPCRELSDGGLVLDAALRAFTYQELVIATNGFSEKLGRGAFGTVFKGTLLRGQTRIAVKKLEKVMADGEVEFQNEIRSIGRTHHKNLVRLLGYCHDKSNILLVYEFMKNGSLADFLFNSAEKLSWGDRTGIALDIARGIQYLPKFAVMLLLLFLMSSIFSSATAQERVSNIRLGSSLTPNPNNTSHWSSDSGQFAFGFYQEGDGFAVGVWLPKTQQRTVIWSANRDTRPLPRDVTLFLSNDGKLIFQFNQGPQIPISDANQSASSASMLDSGNFVLYDSESKIIWQTFTIPTDTIVSGQSLFAGQILISRISNTNHSSGKYQLIMQKDGNLVMYPVKYALATVDAYWQTQTDGAGDNVSLQLDKNGRLNLLNGSAILKRVDDRKTISGYSIYRATIDADGIFRMYSFNPDQNDKWSIEWSSSNNKCDPTGLCGLNSYCTLQDEVPSCFCPPGFVFIDQSQTNLGCKISFPTVDCKSVGNSNFSIQELKDISWEDSPYSILSANTETMCREECSRDCNCEAAIYKNQECRKQKLPLRYVRDLKGEQITLFIKVSIGSSRTTMGGTQRNNKRQRIVLIIGIVLLTLSIFLLATFCVLFYRYRIWNYKKISNHAHDEMLEDVTLRSFTYDELNKATNNFMNEIGKGAFGTVFRGILLTSNRVVAVKRLDRGVADGEREFRNEMKVIGRTHHRNLVRLFGYCHDGTNRLLVYEFMNNGSLVDFLFNAEQKPAWEERIDIALNIARGLFYLHEECATQVIHCDIKPITVKADVYSFGIMLLEIICCRRNVDMDVPDDEVVLANWVYDCFEAKETNKLIKDEEVEESKLERMVKVGLWCIQDEPTLRPSMKKVVLMLEGTVDIPAPPTPPSFTSSV